jgi:hypothetical protein
MAGGGSGGGGTTQQSNQFTSLSPWAQPYVTSMLGVAQSQVFNTDPSGNISGINKYTPYGYGGAGMSPDAQNAALSSVAGFTPLQGQAFQGASNLQTPEQYGQATGAAGQGILQALSAGNQYQNMATQSICGWCLYESLYTTIPSTTIAVIGTANRHSISSRTRSSDTCWCIWWY